MKHIKGVPYYRFCVYYTLATGERRRMIRYSPGYRWVRSEVTRELVERFDLDGIKPASVSIHFAE